MKRKYRPKKVARFLPGDLVCHDDWALALKLEIYRDTRYNSLTSEITVDDSQPAIVVASVVNNNDDCFVYLMQTQGIGVERRRLCLSP